MTGISAAEIIGWINMTKPNSTSTIPSKSRQPQPPADILEKAKARDIIPVANAIRPM